MYDKLEFHQDRYETETIKIIYVLSRLGGDAAERCYFRRQPKATNPYLVAEDVMDELRDLYEDPF